MGDIYNKAGVRTLIVFALVLIANGNSHSKKMPGNRKYSSENLGRVNTTTQVPVTCSGNITLTSQAQVDAFPATYGCNEISGTLTISGNDIVSLDSLHFVTKVDGDLRISNNPNLTSIKGLS